MHVLRQRPILSGVDLSEANDWSDPYPHLAEIRSQGPIVWSDAWEVWLTADHASSQGILRSPSAQRHFVPRAPEPEWESFNRLNALAALDMSGDDHNRVRRTLTPIMRKDRLAQVSSLVQQEIDRLLDEVAAQTTATVDLVPSFLEPLPVNVICAVLGLPEDSRARLRAASVLMVSAFEKIQTPAEALASQEASRELEDYFTDLASASGATEESGALFDLVRQSPETLSPEEVVANSVLLFNGGTGAVINALGSGLVSLLSQGTQGRLIPSHGDSSILVAVEEMLRHETPIQLFERVAAEDIEFNGVQIARGERLALLLGGANRDPHVFHDPDQFDIRRDPNPHLAFSAGAHFCLGAPLARLEMQLALASILERFPRIMLAKEPVRSTGFVVRGYDSIAVTLNN